MIGAQRAIQRIRLGLSRRSSWTCGSAGIIKSFDTTQLGLGALSKLQQASAACSRVAFVEASNFPEAISTQQELDLRCLHPRCPMGQGAPDWEHVVDLPELRVRRGDRAALLASLNGHFLRPPSNPLMLSPAPTANGALLRRLVQLCPCLSNQFDYPVSASAVVHLCELTLGHRIGPASVQAAFEVQHPRNRNWRYPPNRVPEAGVGDISELLCSDLLSNEGVPQMDNSADDWPVWRVPGHILLNKGRMRDLKALGDILIPCAPTNLIVSVKTESARERLLYSANSIEGVGFGFFSQPEEFTSRRRIQLFKRMGFSALYLPDATLAAVAVALNARGAALDDVQNIYGTHLYRGHSAFADDMRRVAGRSAFDL